MGGKFTEDHEIFRRTLRNFCENELAPHAQEWERDEIFPRWVFNRFGEMGFFGIRYPEDVGGSGLDYWYTVVYAEDLPRCRTGGLPMAMMVQSEMATPIIDKVGTKEQREEFLAPAIRGEKIAALGVTEPNAGSDVARIRTTAKRDGDDYLINGSKTFITNGTRADFITLAVKTRPEEGFHGVSVFLVPTNLPGYTVTRKLKKMGNHSSDTAEIHLDNVRVPGRYLLGEENSGFYYIMQNFQGERLIGAISALAGAELTLLKTIDYCQQREVFGRPISKFQVNRHKIVDMATKIEAARQLNYHCADLYNQDVNCVKEISMAKIFAGELAIEVAHHCVQLHGGYGYMDEYDVSRAYRDSRLITIGGGTSEVMKEIISKLMNL
ncbi:MAG: acyl-CoA dehydrogenase [Deltaproteobacteria bacterium RBG_13_65_10]|nr:MAG: acyl-CoA dehydrogenase [Deltaproteobacteria bacterium RBG_13_65_10]